jgi:hypothetical protein
MKANRLHNFVIDRGDGAGQQEAELGIVEAQLACLRVRWTTAMSSGTADAAREIASQIREASAARHHLLQATGAAPVA